MSNRLIFWTLLFISFFLVAFGQPAWISGCGMLCSVLGYSLFWAAMLQFSKRAQQFFISLFWYAAVQSIHLSWMTSTYYMGPLILAVYVGLLLGLGLQFGLFSCLLLPSSATGAPKAAALSQARCLALSGFWVWMEWIRLYFLTGFTWNPTGLALTDSSLSIQWASVFGVYGLSFWVIWTNLTGLNAWFLERSRRSLAAWAILAIFPYAFGFAHQWGVERYFASSGQIKAALVETGLTVEQKSFCSAFAEEFIPALDQWERVLAALGDEPFDLIVLPETAFPHGESRPICSLEEVAARWENLYGEKSLSDFPPLRAPWAFVDRSVGKERWRVNNAFLAQSLANRYRAEVIIGLDVQDLGGRYNAAFHFSPGNVPFSRYEKRILAPIGEYVPLKEVKWIADFLAKEFGIFDSFDAGTEAKIFHSSIPIGVAICLEELYSGIVHDLRAEGAQLLVSLSNDVWFPDSKLPRQHFDHGRLRAVENGVFLLRATNMGVTGGIDCFGRSISCLETSKLGAQVQKVSIPIFSFPTFHSLWGDRGILLVSAFFVGGYLISLSRIRLKKLP